MSCNERSHSTQPGSRAGHRRVGRREGGSVVTYVVTGFMIVALAIYLAVAFFGDEGGPAPPDAPTPAAAERP
jgi:hypothetical protein